MTYCFYRDLLLEGTCELLSHDAYFMAQYIPYCLDYLDALAEFVDQLNYYALEFPVCSTPTSYNHKGKQPTDSHVAGFNVRGSSQAALQHKKSNGARSVLFQDRIPRSIEHYKRMKKYLSENVRPRAFDKGSRGTLSAAKVIESIVAWNLSSDSRARLYDPCTEQYLIGE